MLAESVCHDEWCDLDSPYSRRTELHLTLPRLAASARAFSRDFIEDNERYGEEDSSIKFSNVLELLLLLESLVVDGPSRDVLSGCDGCSFPSRCS